MHGSAWNPRNRKLTMHAWGLFYAVSDRLLCLLFRYLEQRILLTRWVSVATTHAVSPCEVLPIIANKVQVVQCMVCGTIDDVLQRMASYHVRVVDQDRPEVDKDEKHHVEMALEGENKNGEMVWERLCPAVNIVEGV